MVPPNGWRVLVEPEVESKGDTRIEAFVFETGDVGLTVRGVFETLGLEYTDKLHNTSRLLKNSCKIVEERGEQGPQLSGFLPPPSLHAGSQQADCKPQPKKFGFFSPGGFAPAPGPDSLTKGQTQGQWPPPGGDPACQAQPFSTGDVSNSPLPCVWEAPIDDYRLAEVEWMHMYHAVLRNSNGQTLCEFPDTLAGSYWNGCECFRTRYGDDRGHNKRVYIRDQDMAKWGCLTSKCTTGGEVVGAGVLEQQVSYVSDQCVYYDVLVVELSKPAELQTPECSEEGHDCAELKPLPMHRRHQSARGKDTACF